MKNVALARAEHKIAHEQGQTDVFELLKLRLQEKPEEIDEATEYFNCSRITIDRWLDGGSSSGGEMPIRQEGFLRKKGLMDGLELPEDPGISDAIYYGVSSSLFSFNQIAEAASTSPNSIRRYILDEQKPIGWLKVRLEWYLHNITVKQNGRPDRPLRPMKRLSELQPELAKLLAACCKGELSAEVIAGQLEVPVDRVNDWLIWGHSKPLPPMMQRIHELFAPFLTEDGNGPRQMPQKGGKPKTKSEVASVAIPTPEPEAQSAVQLTTVTKSTAQVIQEQGELLRCLLLGFVSSRQPSKATAELEAIRVQNPDLWFELSLLVGVVADPSERYPAWRKSRR